MEPADNVLEHYGTKGMKWGVRKAPTPVVTKVTPGRKVKATGGKRQTAHPDAVKAATSRQVAKKSTTDALSNNELRDLVNRLSLEQQYSRLDPSRKSLGRRFAESNFGQALASYAAYRGFGRSNNPYSQAASQAFKDNANQKFDNIGKNRRKK